MLHAVPEVPELDPVLLDDGPELLDLPLLVGELDARLLLDELAFAAELVVHVLDGLADDPLDADRLLLEPALGLVELAPGPRLRVLAVRLEVLELRLHGGHQGPHDPDERREHHEDRREDPDDEKLGRNGVHASRPRPLLLPEQEPPDRDREGDAAPAPS